MTATAELAASVASIARRATFRYANEDELQAGLTAALEQAGHRVTREMRLTESERVDLLVDDEIGVEVKIAGNPYVVAEQLARYARHPWISVLVLVTSRTEHEQRMPVEIEGVPVIVARLRRRF